MKVHMLKVRRRIEVPVVVHGSAQDEPFELNKGEVVRGVVRSYVCPRTLREVCDIDMGYGYVLTGVPTRHFRFVEE